MLARAIACLAVALPKAGASSKNHNVVLWFH